MSVSVSMITRNSSDVLERCLESVKDADEIVIVDTGSEDNTKEIALRYTDKVYDYYGCNEPKTKDGLFMDFADARNHSLEKCTSTHVLTIDADEVLCEGGMAKLKEFEGVSLSIKCIADRSGEEHHQPRLYKNHPQIQWKGAAHNYLTCYEGDPSDVTITYHSNKQRRKDPDRTMRILERWVKNNRKDCTRELYYLAKEYHKREWFKKAGQTYIKYLKRSNFTAEKADAYIQLSRIMAALGKDREAINACMASINLNPDCSEALILAGDLNGTLNRLKFHHLASKATNQGVIFYRPDQRLRVTMLSDWDWAGSGYRIVEAVRDESEGSIDIEAIVVNAGQGSPHFQMKTGVPFHLLSKEIIQDRINRSDIVHYKSDYPYQREFNGITIPDHVKIVRTVSGSEFRAGVHRLKKYDCDFNSYMTKDLHVDGWEYMPQPYNRFDYKWKRGKKFIISHIASDPLKKGTAFIQDAIKLLGRNDIEFICLSGVSYLESLKIKSKSHLYIDQMLYPPVANASYEAMGYGVPVITWTDGTDDIVVSPAERTAESLAQTISSLLDWDKLEELSKYQYQAVKERCGDMGINWINVYKKLKS